MVTVGLPTYNNSDIVWLQLESLCNQVEASNWELIMIEEPSEKYFGEVELLKYKDRLFKAGCVEIKYIDLTEWIPLGQKWLEIGKEMNDKSKAMLLCASDNYSPEWRIKKTEEAFDNGADWYQSKSGYFYNILNHEASKFDMIFENRPSLFMSVSKEKLRNVHSLAFPKKGVDTWLFNKVNPVNLVQEDFAFGGVHTDGFNTISHGRNFTYKGGVTPLFEEVESNEVFNIFPKKVQERLIKMRNESKS